MLKTSDVMHERKVFPKTVSQLVKGVCDCKDGQKVTIPDTEPNLQRRITSEKKRFFHHEVSGMDWHSFYDCTLYWEGEDLVTYGY